MVVQCNASNKHGYIFSDVYLNIVKAYVSTISKPPAALTKAAEGQSVELTCRTSGNTDSRVTWYFNHQPLRGHQFTVLPNGDLRLDELLLSNTGEYMCVTESSHGKVNASGQLIVRSKTKIVSAPQDLEVKINTPVNLTCLGSTDPMEIGNLVVSWMKDGTPVTSDSHSTEKIYHQGNSLIINGMTGSDSGAYTCVVSNGIDNATATTFLTVKDPTRPPEIYAQASHTMMFIAGEAVELLCKADSKPLARYYWKKNNILLYTNGSDGHITQHPTFGTVYIDNCRPEDEGAYQCFAENDYGISLSAMTILRQVYLMEFFPHADETHRPQLGSHLTLPCAPPRSYPDSEIIWVLEVNSVAVPIVYDNRVTMDHQGFLRITNVVAEDGQNGVPYVCMAINRYSRMTKTGHKHYIIPSGVEVPHPVSMLWGSPMYLGLVGEEVKLKCIFAGNPTPVVSWARVDGELPNHRLESYGQELIISDLQVSHAGTYECRGSNSVSIRTTATVDLRVESHPYWIQEPKYIEVDVGGNATFICEAGGTPAPWLYLFVNGVPLADVTDPQIVSGQFLKQSKQNITLVNLAPGDAMVIQCNATNRYGYIFSDVYLNVLSEIPKLIRPPELVTKAAEGQSLNLTCRFSGRPVPTIKWLKNSVPITDGHYTILPSGDLHVTELVLADSGNYQCEAENVFGRVTANGTLIVRRKTSIVISPRDLELIAGTNATFTCSAATDPEEVASISWLRNGQPIPWIYGHFQQNQDGSLSINDTVYSDSATYTCVANNGLDSAIASAILIVKDRPDPPSSVSFTACYAHRAEIAWVEGNNKNAPIQNYIVQYNTSFDTDYWVTALTTDGNQTAASITLSPWANYTVRVIAKNEIGESNNRSRTWSKCSTPPSRPYKNPENVRSIGNKKGFLVIEWTLMPLIEHNGFGFRYILDIRRQGEPFKSTIVIEDWRLSSFEMPVPGVYEVYEVQLKASNIMGDTIIHPVIHTLHSGEDVPQVVVNDFAIDPTVPVSDREVSVKWSWDMDAARSDILMRGEFQGFKIKLWQTGYKASTEREILISVDMQPTSTNVRRKKRSTLRYERITIDGLLPKTQYEMQVQVMNTFYNGPASNAVSLQTMEGTEIGQFNSTNLKLGQSTLGYLQSAGYPSSGIAGGSTYMCSVETDCGQTLRISLIDIRLVESAGTCKQRLLIIDEFSSKTVSCDNNNEFIIKEFYNSHGNYLLMELHSNLSRDDGFAWIGIQGSGSVSVSCPAQGRQHWCAATTVGPPTTERTTGVSDTTTKASVSDTTTKASVSDTTTKATVSDTTTKASISDTTTKASVSDTTTKASVSDTTTKASVSDTTTKASVSDTTTKASVSDTTTKATVSDTTTKASVSDTTTKATVSDTTTKASISDTTTKATVSDTTINDDIIEDSQPAMGTDELNTGTVVGIVLLVAFLIGIISLFW
ncbi:hypothetical protein ScPMuIL_008516 [Solemya velum]